LPGFQREERALLGQFRRVTEGLAEPAKEFLAMAKEPSVGFRIQDKQPQFACWAYFRL
jgi:hypothetical protein